MPPERRTVRMDLNRVEGDMEVRLELDGHTVTDAWCVGTMYRGFEQILVGCDPSDALVIAPRICGICSTSQLYAAASALETAYGAQIAPNGTRIRNLCLMAESVMSDARHTFLMFAPDFCNEAYGDHPLYARAMELFEPPFKGRLAAETVEATKRILAIVIAFGGQWPHSTYMMSGGVTCALDDSKLDECEAAIDAYADWYEREILACTCDEWLALETAGDFDAWMEVPAHRESAVGVFTRFGRSIGLHELGGGTPHLLSAGCYSTPSAGSHRSKSAAACSPAASTTANATRSSRSATGTSPSICATPGSSTPAAPAIRGTARRSRTPPTARPTATLRRRGTRTTWSSWDRWRTWWWAATR